MRRSPARAPRRRVEHVTVSGRQRFEREPWLEWFVRPLTPGEFHPQSEHGIDRVQVIQITPNVRQRVPLPIGIPPVDIRNPRTPDELYIRRTLDLVRVGARGEA